MIIGGALLEHFVVDMIQVFVFAVTATFWTVIKRSSALSRPVTHG